MSQMILVAAVCFGFVAIGYGIYGGLTAGANWKNWLFQQALPLYGVMLFALISLIAIMMTFAGATAGG